MKPRKFKKKLSFQKVTVSHLNQGVMRKLAGGQTLVGTPCITGEESCAATCYTCETCECPTGTDCTYVTCGKTTCLPTWPCQIC